MNKGIYVADNRTVFHEDTGKLYFFSKSYVQVLKGWPKPCAWIRTYETPRWTHCRPSIKIPKGNLEGKIRKLSMPYNHHGQLLLPEFYYKKEFKKWEDLAWNRWYDTIPLHVRKSVSIYRDRQWHMLEFVACCGPVALDLIKANPALAYALASNWVFHKPQMNQPLRFAQELLKAGKNQRDVLAWLGFQPSEQIRRILRKIVARSVSIGSLLSLRQRLQDDRVVKTLSHLDRINRGVIRIIIDPELFRFVSPVFLHELSQSKNEDRKATTAWVLRHFKGVYEYILSSNRKFPVLNSLKKLDEFCIMIQNKVCKIQSGKIDVAFPPPPVAGTPSIIPFVNSHELIEEGVLQKNCVADYIGNVAFDKNMYLYKILSPERCTLSLEKNGSQWKIGQLARACNRAPSIETISFVKTWLKENTAKEVLHDNL